MERWESILHPLSEGSLLVCEQLVPPANSMLSHWQQNSKFTKIREERHIYKKHCFTGKERLCCGFSVVLKKTGSWKTGVRSMPPVRPDRRRAFGAVMYFTSQVGWPQSYLLLLHFMYKIVQNKPRVPTHNPRKAGNGGQREKLVPCGKHTSFNRILF